MTDADLLRMRDTLGNSAPWVLPLVEHCLGLRRTMRGVVTVLATGGNAPTFERAQQIIDTARRRVEGALK